MKESPRVGLLGGTLDPMHVGHVETARAAMAALGLDRVIVLPARIPPHRPGEPMASPFHRFAMAALCAADHDWMTVSDDELRAPGPSFTAATLERLLAAGYERSQLFFITGADAFAEIDTWHRYPDVLTLASFAVVSRPGWPVGELAARLPALAGRFRTAAAPPRSSGPAIFLVDARTPDVSSTDIRRRLAGAQTVAGLLCPAVLRHITRHHLYDSGARSGVANELHGQD
jgi:nicotinate-nucleotide adenylyltransferase